MDRASHVALARSLQSAPADPADAVFRTNNSAAPPAISVANMCSCHCDVSVPAVLNVSMSKAPTG